MSDYNLFGYFESHLYGITPVSGNLWVANKLTMTRFGLRFFVVVNASWSRLNSLLTQKWLTTDDHACQKTTVRVEWSCTTDFIISWRWYIKVRWGCGVTLTSKERINVVKIGALNFTEMILRVAGIFWHVLCKERGASLEWQFVTHGWCCRKDHRRVFREVEPFCKVVAKRSPNKQSMTN